MAKNPKGQPKPLHENTAALKAHTRALNRHSKALESVLASHTPAVETLAAGHRHFTKLQIKQAIADITGNPVGSLNDNIQVSKIFAGIGGTADDIMDQINHAFGLPPLTLAYAGVSGLKIGGLVNLIYGSL